MAVCVCHRPVCAYVRLVEASKSQLCCRGAPGGSSLVGWRPRDLGSFQQAALDLWEQADGSLSGFSKSLAE
eukprot:12015883-Alexandrium_andersonii.AAC.1